MSELPPPRPRTERAPAPRFRARVAATEAVWLPALCAVALLVSWELFTRIGLLSPFLTSSPSQILDTATSEVASREFLEDVRVSAVEFCLGYGLGVLLAVPLGLAVGRFRRFGYMVEPWLDALNATPRIALLPLVMLWLGIGLSSKVAIIFLGVFVTVTYNAYYGVRSVDRNLMQVTDAFGSSKWYQFKTLIWPTSVPFVLTGMRLGIGRGVAGLMIAEFSAADAGLGHYIFVSGQSLQADKVLFGASVLTVLALLGFGLLGLLERHFESWRPALRKGE